MSGRLFRWLRPAPTTAASLLALFALIKMEGTSTAVPILAALILLSTLIPARLPDTPAVTWLVRVTIFALVVVSNLSRPVDTMNMFDTRTMTWFGELCAAELTLASWMSAASERASARPLWLSGLVMLAASSTTDDTFMIVIAPAYFFALLVALRWSGPGTRNDAPPRPAAPWRFGIAVACALLGGGGISALLTAQRSALMTWGMQVLGEHVRFESGALSLDPTLTSTFGQRGSMTRAMRIEGEGEFSHMRGVAYSTYDAGTWGPRTMDRQRDEPITTELEPLHPTASVRVTRLLNNHGLIFAPLNAAGLRFTDGAPLYRVSARGGMLRTAASAPSQYDIALAGDPDFQGPLCSPPSDPLRTRLLAVPSSIEPRVRQLCAQVVRGIADPRRRLDAIEHYLISHHRYSLSTEIGRGDPVSNFLLKGKSAHCEYFASAAVILARIAGVPSRYVIGYLAHEGDGKGITIVRQRDAHAWAECWLDDAGWIVLDATPGDGRPDALNDRPSPMARAIERIQDMVNALRLGSRSGSLLKIAIAAVAIILLAAAARALWTLRANWRPARAEFGYSSSSAELAALFRDFERACRVHGLACPPGHTWMEFLETVEASPGAAGMPSSARLNSAREFVRLYNAARFGEPPSARQMDSLRLLLASFAPGRALEDPVRMTVMKR